MLRDLPGKQIKCCPKEHQPHPAEYNPTQLLCCSGPGDLPTPYPPLLLFEAGDVVILMLIFDVVFIFPCAPLIDDQALWAVLRL